MEAAVCAATERVTCGFFDVGFGPEEAEAEAEDRRITGVQSCMLGLGSDPVRLFTFLHILLQKCFPSSGVSGATFHDRAVLLSKLEGGEALHTCSLDSG